LPIQDCQLSENDSLEKKFALVWIGKLLPIIAFVKSMTAPRMPQPLL
jgi:hypothetical protein